MVFPWYLEESPWRRVTVVLGTEHAVRSLGGYVGGIRPAAGIGASPSERVCIEGIWEKHRPEERIL